MTYEDAVKRADARLRKVRSQKKERKWEIIRHANLIMVGILIFLMIGVVGRWETSDNLTRGEAVMLIIGVLYVIGYGLLHWRYYFGREI